MMLFRRRSRAAGRLFGCARRRQLGGGSFERRSLLAGGDLLDWIERPAAATCTARTSTGTSFSTMKLLDIIIQVSCSIGKLECRALMPGRLGPRSAARGLASFVEQTAFSHPHFGRP